VDGIREGKPIGALKAEWQADIARFKQRREKFLLYK
jgi:hypothetical protein